MARADAGGKRTIHLFARAWAEWIVHQQHLTIESELSGEFQLVARATDALLLVRDERHSRFLLLTELQTEPQLHMPVRLTAYAALAREKYRLDIFVAVVYLLPPAAHTTLPDRFHSEFMGQTAHQDFAVIRLWELDASDALALQNPALLPFIPLMRGGATEETLRICAGRIRVEPEAAELEVLLATFASFVMNVDIVMRIVRWNMQILRESPLYKELFKDYERGREDGIEIGRVEGQEIGRVEGQEIGRNAAATTLCRLLTYRFQVPETYYAARLQQFSLTTIRRLTDTAFDASSLAEFESVLQETEGMRS